MRKNYGKKKSRSRRKTRKPQGKVLGFDSDEKEASIRMTLPVGDILAGMHDAVEALAAEAGLLMMKALIDEEVDQIVGARYGRDPKRRANRWGSEEGHVIFAGRKVPLKRPRIRGMDGREVQLERYRSFRSPSRMPEEIERRIVRRVSTRNYEGVIDELCEGYGIRKSSVSRHWKTASAKKLKEMMERPLGELDFAAILIDGIHFHEYLFVVAVGLDKTGKKHVLGLWQGATETAAVCGSLIDHLIERGLDPNKNYLFVLDGSKALRAAVVERFGADAIIQRCTVHKERNVLDHISKKYQAVVRLKLRAAWDMKSYADAKAALRQVVSYLRNLNPAAAKSLEEAFEETLTVHRLEVPETLRKSLRSTNIIESCFSTTRDLCLNVKRWRNADMAWRWAGTMLLEAEKRFRRVNGRRSMSVLLAALDRTSKKTVDEKQAIA